MIMSSLAKKVSRNMIRAAFLGGLVSCVTYTTETSRMREAFGRGDYDLALQELEKSGTKNRSQDRLLWHLEAGTIYDRKGDYQASRKLWFQADRIADDLFTLSISKTLSSLVVNEASTDYDGEDYEVVAIHALLAHQYIALGQLDEARVQARKINTKLSEISQKFDSEGRYRYREDAHARYLSALIYEARAEWDNAIVDYRKALELYEGDFSGYIVGGIPNGVITGLTRCLQMRGRTDLIKSLSTKYPQLMTVSYDRKRISELRDQAEIVVIHELGRVALKTANEQFLTVGEQLVRFSSTIIEPNPLIDAGTGITLDQLQFYQAENTVYFDAVAKDSLEFHRQRKTAKQISRLLLKGEINHQANKQLGPIGGLAMNVFNNATETADTRSWTTLPQAFFITRARVSPGQYSMTIKTNGQESRPQSVVVARGGIRLFRSFDR